MSISTTVSAPTSSLRRTTLVVSAAMRAVGIFLHLLAAAIIARVLARQTTR